MTWTRKDYMDGLVSHQSYYAQFVTESLKSTLARHIGAKRIKASKDKYFNDIPLREWDQLACCVPVVKLRECNGPAAGVSLSDKVCVLKAAARAIRGAL